LADLIAHPSRQDILIRNNAITSLQETFENQIIEILEKDKYYRSIDGRINGFGRKFLP